MLAIFSYYDKCPGTYNNTLRYVDGQKCSHRKEIIPLR